MPAQIRILGVEGFLPGLDPNATNSDGGYLNPHLRNNHVVLIADGGLQELLNQRVYVASARIGASESVAPRPRESVISDGAIYRIKHSSLRGTAAIAELETWKATAYPNASGKSEKDIPPEGSPPVDVTVVIPDPTDPANNAGSGGATGTPVYP